MEQFTPIPLKPSKRTRKKMAKKNSGAVLELEEQEHHPPRDNLSLHPPIGKFYNTLEKHGKRLFCFLCNQYCSRKNYKHLEHKLHKDKLHKLGLKNSDSMYSKNLSEVPREPIFSDAIIQEHLNNFKSGPLIGLEYLIELPRRCERLTYICALCVEWFGVSGVISHLSKKSHKAKYIFVYFRTYHGRIQGFGSVTSKSGFKICLNKVVEYIEEVCGRLKPMRVPANKFFLHQLFYLQLIRNGKHHNERSNGAFRNLLNFRFFKKILPMLKRKVKNPSRLAKFMSRVKYHEESMSDNEIQSSKIESTTSSVQSTVQYTHESRTRELSQSIMTDKYQTEGACRAMKLEEQNNLSKVIDEQMEQANTDYTELHPEYNEEWKKSKYTKLEAEAKNRLVYDIKSERKEDEPFLEKHQDEIKSEKTELKQEFDLDKMMPISTDNSQEVVLVDDDCDSAFHQTDEKYIKSFSRDPSPVQDRPSEFRKRSRSGEEICSEPKKVKEEYVNYEYQEQFQQNSFLNEEPHYAVNDIPADEISFIAVLRLLTALKQRLGCLGPKVLDLMTQALIMENKNAEPEELLNNEVNCKLLDTVKEKLKGQLEARLVEREQQKNFHKIIRDIERFVSVSVKKRKENEAKFQEKLVEIPGEL